MNAPRTTGGLPGGEGSTRAWLVGEELDKGRREAGSPGRGLASCVQRGGNGPERRAEQGWVSGFWLAWWS